jgi:16S rRNA (uracil1498-N3)-methyltransferase
MHHACDVLRLSAGNIVRAFNCRGEWNCEITDVKKRTVRCVSLFREPRIERGPAIACSLINPKRFDFLLEKVTELGASEIIPIIADRSQYKNINLQKSQQKVIQACEQSGRLTIPLVKNVAKVYDFLKEYSSHCRILVGDAKLSSHSLRQVIEEKCVFLIGPEGGFSDEENILFDRCENLCKFSLGANILRSETAAIAFISIWSGNFS